jgi:hypothetical protein
VQTTETRLSAGSGLMLEKLLDAADRTPAFEWFVISGFPVREIRQDGKSYLDLEREIPFVIEQDADSAAVIRDMRRDLVNDLTFELGE